MYLGQLIFCAVVSGIATATNQPDSQTIAAYEKSGTCFWYTGQHANWAKSKQPCLKYCQDHVKEVSDYGCTASAYGNIDYSTVKPSFKDDDGWVWIPAQCKCNQMEFAVEIFDLVAQALKEIDLVCKVVLSIFNELLQVGLDFVPGAGEVKMAYQGLVKGAKTFAENAFDAADFLGGWVGPACGDPGWSGDIFSLLTDAPDSYGVSAGCSRSSKACKKLDKKPDRTTAKDTKTTLKTSTTKATTAQTTTTQKTTTSSAKTSKTSTDTTHSSSKTSSKASSSTKAMSSTEVPSIQASSTKNVSKPYSSTEASSAETSSTKAASTNTYHSTKASSSSSKVSSTRSSSATTLVTTASSTVASSGTKSSLTKSSVSSKITSNISRSLPSSLLSCEATAYSYTAFNGSGITVSACQTTWSSSSTEALSSSVVYY